MRPPGEIRRALRDAAQAQFAERGQGATWRELAQRARIGLQVARRTVDNMARAGELQVAGSVRVPGACRPMTAYVPATAPDPGPAPHHPLDLLLRTWAG